MNSKLLGPFAPYGVELLLEERPQRGWQALFDALQAELGDVQPFADLEDAAGVALPSWRTDLPDARCVPMTYQLLYLPEGRDRTGLIASLEQSQNWLGARSAVARSKASLYLCDMPGLRRAQRLELFHRVLRAAVSQLPVLAIHWIPAQHLVDPSIIRSKQSPLTLSDGAVHVRLFKVANAPPGELFMDTCGMASFGLPDVQHCFLYPEPNDIAARLFGVASYLFDHGDVIQHGDMVEGIEGPWKCSRERSAAAPDREVLAFSIVEEPEPIVVPARREVRCPACGWSPGPLETWPCTCGMMWNPFDTRGRCPSCDLEYPETDCHACGAVTEHGKWYGSAPPADGR